jgi:hypothetical protein
MQAGRVAEIGGGRRRFSGVGCGKNATPQVLFRRNL